MCDCAAKRRISCANWIDMNELIIATDARKSVDPRLIDVMPVRHAHVLADKGLYFAKAVIVACHVCSGFAVQYLISYCTCNPLWRAVRRIRMRSNKTGRNDVKEVRSKGGSVNDGSLHLHKVIKSSTVGEVSLAPSRGYAVS